LILAPDLQCFKGEGALEPLAGHWERADAETNHRVSTIFFVMTLLAACSSMYQYEQQVEDFEPVYCYQSIGSVQCYKAPKLSDSGRLVNF
jgi:hypothetical protein